MKNSSNRTPPLLRGALALMGLILLTLGGFSPVAMVSYPASPGRPGFFHH